VLAIAPFSSHFRVKLGSPPKKCNSSPSCRMSNGVAFTAAAAFASLVISVGLNPDFPPLSWTT